MIWFLEGQSSQRDILLGAREALPPEVKIFASHRQERPEITGLADVSFLEPKDNQERIDWVIETALTHKIKVILPAEWGVFSRPSVADSKLQGWCWLPVVRT